MNDKQSASTNSSAPTNPTPFSKSASSFSYDTPNGKISALGFSYENASNSVSLERRRELFIDYLFLTSGPWSGGINIKT